jgi:hypothetical protein
MYPDYRYPLKGQKRKSATSGKDVASAAPSEPAPKRRKVKVLTHRPRYIEPTTVPEFGGEISSATKADKPALTQKIEELAIMPKVNKIEEHRIKETKISEVLSPSAEVTVLKAQKDLIATPKRKRMVNVLDVLETIKNSSSTPGKTAEASKTEAETKLTEVDATKSQARTEAGPSKPAKEKSLETGEKETENKLQNKFYLKELSLQLPKHLLKYLIILYDMLQEKGYLKKKSENLNITPRN